MNEPHKKQFVPRVTQLDAVELDGEVVGVLKGQLLNALKYTSPGLLGKWEPEIDATLRFIIWKFSVQKWYGTFGQQLLGLKYGGDYSTKKVWMLAVFFIGSKYIQDRSVDIVKVARNPTLSNVISQLLNWTELALQVGSVANFLTFLQEGKYPTLVDRILGLQPVPLVMGQTRAVGYKYMKRELLWHGFIELLTFSLPLINFHAVRRRILGYFHQPPKATSGQQLTLSNDVRCAVCGEKPVLPQHIGCAHLFCFYCIHANHLADSKFGCPLCGHVPEDESSIIPLKM